MSNSAVGGIYKRIIDAVVEVARTDFEENGVPSDVLQLLQDKWQERLSQTQRALFPWDPQPDPPKGSKVEMTGPSPASSQSNPVHVKQEPFNDSFLTLPAPGPYAASGLSQPHVAQQRAAHLMAQQFGQQASNSIGAMQASGMSLPPVQPRPQNMQMPRPQAQQHNGQQGVYKHEANSGSLEYAQTDGAGDARDDWQAVVMQRNAHGDDEPLGRIAVDGMIRKHVEAMAQRLEGGGLMVPLDERRPTIAMPRKKQKTSSRRPGPARYDGEDEEEIGSDLDDPDDDHDQNQEDSMDGDVILCLYDKVQRVKNKWKCTLKDGVVTVEGKDYVFHKAQGEFEW